MHPPDQEFDLPKLRRQLEEILAIVNGQHNGVESQQIAHDKIILSVHENDASAYVARADECSQTETTCEPVLRVDQPAERDDLYDDALVVVTEFGHASPAVLQMWLSIDYSRAITILNRFQADGLVSSKGRVRHKAYSLRRSEA